MLQTMTEHKKINKLKKSLKKWKKRKLTDWEFCLKVMEVLEQ